MVIGMNEQGSVAASAPVNVREVTKIDIDQDIAIEHDERLRQEMPGIFDRACGAHRPRLVDVRDRDAELCAVAEMLLDFLEQIAVEEHEIRKAAGLAAFDEVLEQRLSRDRNHRLRPVAQSEPRSLTARKNDDLHALFLNIH